jgi:hypothetical protein
MDDDNGGYVDEMEGEERVIGLDIWGHGEAHTY